MSSGDVTQGKRLPDATWTHTERETGVTTPGYGWDAFYEKTPGTFMKVSGVPNAVGGRWMVISPNGLMGTIRDDVHTVTEHDDETITVSPSILINAGAAGEWHGFLEHGVWREA